MNSRQCCAGILSLFGFVSSLFGGETITVDNVTDLTNHLDRLNRLNTAAFDASGYSGNRYDTIILKKGFYDVSGCEMLCSTEKKGLDYIDSFSHIAISWLTLKGETGDPKDVVIYGNKSNRIVYMWLGTLQDVTISNGYAKVDKTINGYRLNKTGGGVASRTQSSDVRNCIITDCKADGHGGGLYYANCYDTIVENCEAGGHGGGVNNCYHFERGIVRGNRAGNCGGGMVDCSADGTVISNNVAVSEGGGAYSIRENANGFTNCLITCNSANLGGGVSYGGNKGVSCCIVSNNTALGNGGGLYNCHAADSLIVGNVAGSTGGGVYGTGSSSASWRRLLRCEVTGNVATNYGGGIAYYVQADGCFVSSNTAPNGGGAYVSCQASNTVFACNTASNRGGGAYDILETMPLVDCTFYGNTAVYGGGMSHVLNARDCIVSNNVAVQGGGVYMSKFKGGKIVFNLARYAPGYNTVFGGGAAADSETGIYSCEVSNAEVYGNAVALETSTSDRSGGAGEHVHFTNCRIYNNFGYVGAALNWGSAVNCVISNNVSLNQDGKVHSHVRGCELLRNCTFVNQNFCSSKYFDSCRISGYVGEWALAEGENVYTNGVFVHHARMSADDGLLGNNMNYAFALTNCLIVGNRCGIVFLSGGKDQTSYFINCTIADNVNASMYGGFHPGDYPNALLYLKNTIIAGNKNVDGQDWNFRPRYGSAESSVVIENCLIGPGGWFWTPATWPVPAGYTWTGLIESNSPHFVGVERNPADPYDLRTGSPARRKGTVEAWMNDAYDIRGDIEDGKYRRLRDGLVDLGCYQCWADPIGAMLLLR